MYFYLGSDTSQYCMSKNTSQNEKNPPSVWWSNLIVSGGQNHIVSRSGGQNPLVSGGQNHILLLTLHINN